MEFKNYLTKLCKHLGLLEEQFSIEFTEEGDLIKAKLVLPEEESGLFIGYHGETLQAIQRVARVSFYDELVGKIFKLNVNDYREQRQEQLTSKVEVVARQVQESGEPYTFSYLTADDRYFVHTTLGEDERFSDLVSESGGEGKHRYLTIRPQE